jgi:hypothetical protein
VKVEDLVILDEPTKVVGLTAVGGDGSITANWSPPTVDGGSPITEYVVKAGGKECRTSALSCTVTGLPNGNGSR